MAAIACQYCSNQSKVLCCSRCSSAYYCSAECQRADYAKHKDVCRIWDPSLSGPVYNPFFTQATDRSMPNEDMLWSHDEELLEAAKQGDCLKLKDCIDRSALLSVVRGRHGESALHLAVTSGKVEAVNTLLNAGAYINVVDWRDATPLYYACTHPALQDEEVRRNMAEFLVSAGADTMQESGFTGMRPWEAATKNGHDMAAEAITGSPLHKKFAAVREGTSSRQATPASKQLVDLLWRSSTATWFIRHNRATMMQNFRPHPQLAAKTPEDVEAIFKDTHARHDRWWSQLKHGPIVE